MFQRLLAFAIILLTACWSGETSADMISLLGNNGNEHLGSFSGNLFYSPSDVHSATLTISLTNTSPADNGGYLTAFAFNNPGNSITGVSLAIPPATSFRLLGSPGFQNGISASPYGSFDIGASISQNFLGGGNPQAGIAPGQSATFTFNFTGTNLDDLTWFNFTHEFSSGGQFLLARFRGFDNNGSDKVPGFVSTPTTHTPIPSTMVLLGTALAGLLGLRKFKRP